MSLKLEKQKTDMTPYVLIDELNEYMKLEGESYHSNIIEFFEDVRIWLDGFLKTDFKHFTFDCQLMYFNSSTVKLLLNLLLDMENSKNSECIIVNWITSGENKMIIECGEDFQEDLKNLTFNIVLS